MVTPVLAGDAVPLLSRHLAAWECCVHICLGHGGKAILTTAFTCAAAPLAILWGTPGQASHAPVRALLRVWKLMLGSMDKLSGDFAQLAGLSG